MSRRLCVRREAEHTLQCRQQHQISQSLSFYMPFTTVYARYTTGLLLTAPWRALHVRRYEDRVVPAQYPQRTVCYSTVLLFLHAILYEPQKCLNRFC